MGLFDGIFGKKEVKEQEIELELSKAISFSDEFFSAAFAEIQKDVFSRFSEIKHLLNEIKLVLSELKEKQIELNEGNPRLRKIALTSRNTLIEKMNLLASKLEPPVSNELNEFSVYCSSSLELLESEVNSFGRNIAYTGIVLKEPIKNLGEKMNELRKVFLELKKLLDSKKNLLLLPEIKSGIEKIGVLVNEKKDSVSAENDLIKRISHEENSLADLRKELEKKRNSVESKKLNELLFPAEKLMKALEKLSDSGRFVLKEEEKAILGLYLSNPFLALKKDNKGEELKKIFNFIKKLVSEGKISLKEKEKQKKLAVLDELLLFDFFGEFFWKLNETEKNLIETEKEISLLDISSEISSLEKKEAYSENLIKSLSAELESQKTKTKRLSEEKNSELKLLEKNLSVFSGKTVLLKQ